MPLYISEKKGVMEVREEIFSFRDTKTSWFYYDMQNRMMSIHGRQGDKPDRPMDQSSYDWAVKHYVPKILPYKPLFNEWLESPEGVLSQAKHNEAQAAQKRSSMAALFQRQAENARLTFAQKCALMLEETGYSVREPAELAQSDETLTDIDAPKA